MTMMLEATPLVLCSNLNDINQRGQHEGTPSPRSTTNEKNEDNAHDAFTEITHELTK